MKETKNNRSNTFYAIGVVIAAFLIYGGGQGILVNALSIFVKPVTDDLGIPRGLFSMCSTIILGVSVVMMPKFARLFTTKQFKKVIIVSSVICSAAALGYAASGKLWQFYALATIQGILVNGVGTAVIGVLINNWFVKKKGLATGIAYAGSGIAAAAFIPIGNAIIDSMGWRAGYVAMAIACGLTLIPTALWIPVRPGDIGLTPYGSDADDEEAAAQKPGQAAGSGDIPFETAVKSTAFYLLLASGFLSAMAPMAATGNAVAYLSDLGYSVALQSTISSLLMLSMAAAKVGIGAILDRFGGMVGICLVCGSGLLGIIFMTMIPSGGIIFAFAMAIFMGMGSTGGHVLASFLANEYWGSKDFSRIYSYLTLPGVLGCSLAIPLPGMIYDRCGSYMPAWYLMIVFAALLFAAEIWARRSALKVRKNL